MKDLFLLEQVVKGAPLLIITEDVEVHYTLAQQTPRNTNCVAVRPRLATGEGHAEDIAADRWNDDLQKISMKLRARRSMISVVPKSSRSTRKTRPSSKGTAKRRRSGTHQADQGPDRGNNPIMTKAQSAYQDVGGGRPEYCAATESSSERRPASRMLAAALPSKRASSLVESLLSCAVARVLQDQR